MDKHINVVAPLQTGFGILAFLIGAGVYVALYTIGAYFIWVLVQPDVLQAFKGQSVNTANQ